MKIVAFSDTHTYHRDVTIPEGDVLIFAGDLMGSGYKHTEVKDFAKWWNTLPHPYKILIAGNHDRLFESNPAWCLAHFKNTHYLIDSEVVIDEVKFWGSPYTPWFLNWAFNVPRGGLYEHWDKIPDDVDVLITHGPPDGILDQPIPNLVSTWGSTIIIPPSEHVGDKELSQAIQRTKPKLHFFGHIHGGYGRQGYAEKEAENLMLPKHKGPIYYNCSICNEQYNVWNQPHVVDFCPKP